LGLVCATGQSQDRFETTMSHNIEISLYKRSLIISGILAVIGIVALVVIGWWESGIGVALGVSLGLWNVKTNQTALARFTFEETPIRRKHMIASSMWRLGLLTVVVIVVALIKVQIGLGTVAGLAVTQLVATGCAGFEVLHNTDKVVNIDKTGNGTDEEKGTVEA
jgi:hypothetical protein